MVTVLRAQGLRVVIFLNDHLPAHVHVVGSGEAKVNLWGSDGLPELVWAEGMSRGEIRSTMRVVNEWQELLLARWKDIHGRTD